MIVCVNKIDNSVCFVVKEPAEVEKFLFLPDQMYFTEMEPINGSYDTMDYVNFVIIDGEWVHTDDADMSPIETGGLPKRKVS